MRHRQIGNSELILVRKAMRREKRKRGLSNLQITGEHEVLDVDSADPDILGRIDIIFQFPQQFGDEDAYLAVECKRVSDGETTLSLRYVSQGVNRFVTGQYATGHHWGMMLAYVLKTPVNNLINGISDRMKKSYGADAELTPTTPGHPKALALLTSTLTQGSSGHQIQLMHIFVDMTAAASTPPA